MSLAHNMMFTRHTAGLALRSLLHRSWTQREAETVVARFGAYTARVDAAGSPKASKERSDQSYRAASGAKGVDPSGVGSSPAASIIATVT